MADLFFSDRLPTVGEIEAVGAALGPDAAVVAEPHPRVVRAGTRRRAQARHLLLPALHALHNHAGWISPGGLNHVCRVLQVPPAEAYGVATFYEMFRTTEPPHDLPVTHVCIDAACQIAGSQALLDELTAAGTPVHPSPCLGQCERAPAVFIQGRQSPDHVPADSNSYSIPQHDSPDLRLLRRVGVVDPTSIDSYIAAGGFQAYEEARSLGPERLIELVRASGLSGRGGAAFPTAVKWSAVRQEVEAGRRAHVIANADESEPGTFKDRVLMELDPFSVVESLMIAALATGASKGWIYVRGEYPLATQRLADAVQQCRRAGRLGDSFDIEIRRGAGAYICGEETALFNSIEGYRGEPRNKPPFPTTHGLFGEPTAVNNPETLVNVLHLLEVGLDAYRAIGTEQSPGTKLFCLSGSVGLPGVYEVPFGTTLGQLLDLAGGVRGRLRAVLLGGAAGTFVGPDQLDMPLTVEDARARGASLGSGVVMAFDHSVDMPAVVRRIAQFFRNESCGQCVPCRVGTQRQVELLDRPSLGAGERALIDEIGMAMADASICGLGHTASGAVRSAIALGLIGGSG